MISLHVNEPFVVLRFLSLGPDVHQILMASTPGKEAASAAVEVVVVDDEPADFPFSPETPAPPSSDSTSTKQGPSAPGGTGKGSPDAKHDVSYLSCLCPMG